VAGSKVVPRLETLGGEAAREVQGEIGWFGQGAAFGAAARASLDGEVEAQSVENPADLDRPGAGVEREIERAQIEGLVDARDRAQLCCARGAQHHHLQPAVLLQLEAVGGGLRLADRVADLLAVVVDALPLGAGAVAREVGGQRRRLEVGALHEQRHLRAPGEHDQDRGRAGEGAGDGSEQVQQRGARGHCRIICC
jgi:hypothetical protein